MIWKSWWPRTASTGDSAKQKRLPDQNVNVTLLIMAKARWGLNGPGGSGLPITVFRKRFAALHFSHGYVHYWVSAASRPS